MFTVRRIGWTLTAMVVILWTIVVVVLFQTNDPPPGLQERPLLLRALTSRVVDGLLWIALVLIGLIWIVLWFGSGVVDGLRGEKPASPTHPRNTKRETRPRQA